MTMPRIDLGSLPGLGTPVGLFGSGGGASPSIDDRIIVIMVYVYRVHDSGELL